MKDRTVMQAMSKVSDIVDRLHLAGAPPQVISGVKNDLEKNILKATFFGNIDGERLEKLFLEAKMPLLSEEKIADRGKVEKIVHGVLKAVALNVKSENAAMKKAHDVYSALQDRINANGQLVKIPGLAVAKIDEIGEALRANGTSDTVIDIVKNNLLFQVRAAYAGWHLSDPKLSEVFQKFDRNAAFPPYGISKIPPNLVALPALLQDAVKSIDKSNGADTVLDTVVGAPLRNMSFPTWLNAPSLTGATAALSYERKPLLEIEKELANTLKDIDRIKGEIQQPPHDNLNNNLIIINERFQHVTALKNKITTIKDQDAMWKNMQTLGWSSDRDLNWENLDTIKTLFTSGKKENNVSSLERDAIESIIKSGEEKLRSRLESQQVKISSDALFSLVNVAPSIVELVNTLKKEGVSKKLIENIIESTSACLQAGTSVGEVVKEFDTQLSNHAIEALGKSLVDIGMSVSVLGMVHGALQVATGSYQLYKDIISRGEIGDRARIANVASDLLPMLADLMNAMPNKTNSTALKKVLTGDWMFDAHLPFDQQRAQFVQLYKANQTEYVKKALEGKLGLFELKMIQGMLANEEGFTGEKMIFEEAEGAKLMEMNQVLERALTAHPPELKEEYTRSIHALSATMKLAAQGAEAKSDATKQVLRSASLTALNAASVSFAIIAAAGITAPAAVGAGVLSVVKKAINTFTDDRAEKIAKIIEKMAPRDLKVFLDQIVAGGRETAGVRMDLLPLTTIDELIAKRAEFITALGQKRAIDPPLPEFDSFDDRWRFIDGCIDTLEKISTGVGDNTLDEEQVKPERDKIIRWLLAAQELTSEKTFDQAVSTHLRQPLYDAIAQAIDKMYGDQPSEKEQLIIDMLKREIGRINVVLPLGDGAEKMLNMAHHYAAQLGVSSKFQNALQGSAVSIQTADLKAIDNMKQFQDKVHPLAEVGSIDSQKEHFLTYKKGFQELQSQREEHENKEDKEGPIFTTKP